MDETKERAGIIPPGHHINICHHLTPQEQKRLIERVYSQPVMGLGSLSLIERMPCMEAKKHLVNLLLHLREHGVNSIFGGAAMAQVLIPTPDYGQEFEIRDIDVSMADYDQAVTLASCITTEVQDLTNIKVKVEEHTNPQRIKLTISSETWEKGEVVELELCDESDPRKSSTGLRSFGDNADPPTSRGLFLLCSLPVGFTASSPVDLVGMVQLRPSDHHLDLGLLLNGLRSKYITTFNQRGDDLYYSKRLSEYDWKLANGGDMCPIRDSNGLNPMKSMSSDGARSRLRLLHGELLRTTPGHGATTTAEAGPVAPPEEDRDHDMGLVRAEWPLAGPGTDFIEVRSMPGAGGPAIRRPPSPTSGDVTQLARYLTGVLDLLEVYFGPGRQGRSFRRILGAGVKCLDVRGQLQDLDPDQPSSAPCLADFCARLLLSLWSLKDIQLYVSGSDPMQQAQALGAVVTDNGTGYPQNWPEKLRGVYLAITGVGRLDRERVVEALRRHGGEVLGKHLHELSSETTVWRSRGWLARVGGRSPGWLNSLVIKGRTTSPPTPGRARLRVAGACTSRAGDKRRREERLVDIVAPRSSPLLALAPSTTN